MTEPKPKDELVLKLATKATPRVVLESVKALCAVAEALGDENRFTVTVDNLNTKAHLRAWEGTLDVLREALKDPATSVTRSKRHADVVESVAQAFLPMVQFGATMFDGRRQIRSITREFVDSAAAAFDAGSSAQLTREETFSRILGVQVLDRKISVRVIADGRSSWFSTTVPRERLAQALASQAEHTVTIDATWIERHGERILAPGKSTVVDVSKLPPLRRDPMPDPSIDLETFNSIVEYWGLQ